MADIVSFIIQKDFKRKLIQLILQIVRGVQNHVGLADVDHARYCVLVTILQVQLPIKHME